MLKKYLFTGKIKEIKGKKKREGGKQKEGEREEKGRKRKGWRRRKAKKEGDFKTREKPERGLFIVLSLSFSLCSFFPLKP